MKRLLLPALGSLLLFTGCGDVQTAAPTVPTTAGNAAEAAAPADLEQLAAPAVPTTAGNAAEAAAPADLDQLAAEGRADEIVALLQPRFDDGSLEPRDAALLARARLVQGELPKAIKVLRTALETSPASTGLSLELASAYNSIGQYKPALQVLEDSRAAGGSDADLALAFGMSRGLNRDLNGARDEFERARAAGANVDDVDYNIALIELEQGELEAAERLLAGVLERNPERTHVRRELARVRFQGKTATIDETRAAANAVLEADEKDWRAWELLGDAEMSVQDFMAARTYYTNTLKWSSFQDGISPPRVEEKYILATESLRKELEEQGIVDPDADQGAVSQPPPLPPGVLERQREKLRRERKAGADDGQ